MTPEAPQTDQPQNDSVQTLIPTKNMPSLLAYYFGIFGLVPILGLPFTFAALIFGIIGLKRFARNPTPGAKGHAITGLVLASIQLFLFIAFIALLFLS